MLKGLYRIKGILSSASNATDMFAMQVSLLCLWGKAPVVLLQGLVQVWVLIASDEALEYIWLTTPEAVDALEIVAHHRHPPILQLQMIHNVDLHSQLSPQQWLLTPELALKLTDNSSQACPCNHPLCWLVHGIMRYRVRATLHARYKRVGV